MNNHEIIAQMKRLAPWHFDIEVAPGLRTSMGNNANNRSSDFQNVGVVKPFEMQSLFTRLYPNGLKGKSFLDVGCNSGGYCFVAKSLGATRTLGYDTREHWIRQAKFLQNVLAYDSTGMEFRVCQLADVEELSQQFDICLFKGVFYHLPDPINYLQRLCRLTRELIIIDSATDSRVGEDCLKLKMESRTHVMSGMDGLAWCPGGPKVVQSILEWCGFPNVEVVYWTKNQGGRFRKQVGAARHGGRMRLIASRESGPVVPASLDKNRVTLREFRERWKSRARHWAHRLSVSGQRKK